MVEAVKGFKTTDGVFFTRKSDAEYQQNVIDFENICGDLPPNIDQKALLDFILNNSEIIISICLSRLAIHGPD